MDFGDEVSESNNAGYRIWGALPSDRVRCRNGGAREAPYSNGEDSSMKQAGWQIVKISDSVSGPVPNR